MPLMASHGVLTEPSQLPRTSYRESPQIRRAVRDRSRLETEGRAIKTQGSQRILLREPWDAVSGSNGRTQRRYSSFFDFLEDDRLFDFFVEDFFFVDDLPFDFVLFLAPAFAPFFALLSSPLALAAPP